MLLIKYMLRSAYVPLEYMADSAVCRLSSSPIECYEKNIFLQVLHVIMQTSGSPNNRIDM